MSKNGSPEQPSTVPESQKPPEGSSVKGWFEDLKKRYESALKESEKGNTWKEKIFFFLTAFLTRVNQLSEEEQKIEDEAAAKTGEVLMQMPSEQIVSVVEKELVGGIGFIDPIVHDFTVASVNVGKGFGTQKFGKISKAMDKMKTGEGVPETLRPDEKAILMAFGLKTVTALKNNPAYDTVEKFAAALGKFDEATKNGKGLQYLKQPKIKELFKFDAGDMAALFKFKELLPDISFDKKVWGMEWSIGSGKLKSSELQRKLTSAPLSYEEAMNLQGSFALLFPNTKDANRAKALMTINQIVLKDGGFPTNRHIAELVFSIDTRDIEKLSEILQA
jgi:hypothetical protein